MAISSLIARATIIVIVLLMPNDIPTIVNHGENPHFYYASSLVQAHDTSSASRGILSNNGASIGGVGVRSLYEPLSYISIPTGDEQSEPKRSGYNSISNHVSDYQSPNDIDDDNVNYNHKHNDIDGGSDEETSEKNEDTHRNREFSPFQERPELSETFSLPERNQLTRELIRDICRNDRGIDRTKQLNDTFLTYCARFKLENLLSSEIFMSIIHKDRGECERILDEFIQLDELINQFDYLFINLLKRYNCNNGYSVKWNCEDCRKAYKDWICATTLPFYTNGERIKPCLSFCERVEQRCPYLHPITKEQYGGQPVFICRDPNIPFVPEITPDIPFSEPGKCYDLCHLSRNSTELLIDSLSKYDQGNCPDKKLIAEAVSLINEPSSSSGGISTQHVDTGRDHFEDESFGMGENRTISSPHGHSGGKQVHVHNKKLEHLREVLTVYKNQPKTHRFGHHAEHAAMDTPARPYIEIHSS